MSQTIEQIIGGVNLTGVIQQTTTGIPDVLPAEFYKDRHTVNEDSGEYTKVTGTRTVARLAAYGSPSQTRNLKDIGKIPVKLLHTVESINHRPSTLMNLFKYDELAIQKMGIDEITRQTREFKMNFDNLRVAAAECALFNGYIYADSLGNLQTTSAGAVINVNFGVPSGNKNQLNVAGSGNLIGTAWSNAAAPIVTNINAIKKAARKLSGYPLKYAFYGENVPDYIFKNTTYRDFLKLNPSANAQATNGNVPNGFCDLIWLPAYEAFFEDQNGVNQDIVNPDGVTFTPAPSMDWWEWLEGTYPVPTTVGAVTGDGAQAAASIMTAVGMFGYGQVIADPTTIKHVAGDTFLPVLKVPKAVFQAIVNF